MAEKPDVSIVGPGRVGTALIKELRQAGYQVPQILGSKTSAKRALQRTAIFWFCVPDRTIASAAEQLAPRLDWKGVVAFHSSGALTSDELSALQSRGALVAAVHPLMTFVAQSVPSLRGVPFAIEGDRAATRAARQVVRTLGGDSFAIAKRDKAAYHAWGGFTSPLLVALLAAGEQVAIAAGLSSAAARKRALPILRQTLENYARFGPAAAFSGPIIRGDVEVVRKHLQVLKSRPEARAAYIALAQVALRFLPANNSRELARTVRAR